MRIIAALVCAVALGSGVLTATAAENPGEESAVGGLRLRSLRSAQELRLDLARAGQTAEAIPRLEPLQELVRDQFLVTDSAGLTGSEIVERWLQAAPRELWQRWNDSVRMTAEQDWQRWQTSRDDTQLRQFLQQYGSSRLGMTAWKALAHRNMDEGRWEHAVAALERVLSHRAAVPADRAQAALELIAIRVRQGNHPAAQSLAREHAAVFAGQNVRWSGASQSAVKILADLLPPGTAQPKSVSPRPTLEPLWTTTVSLPQELQHDWQIWRQRYRTEGAWLNPVAEPVILGNRVIVPTLTGLAVHDAETSKLHWQTLHDDWQHVVPELEKGSSFENRDRRHHVLDQLVRRESADSILGRVTTDGQRIFAVSSGVGTEMDRLSSGRNAALRDDGTALPVENRLSAFDMKTGETLWRIGGTSAGPTYPFSRMFFCGPPCVVDETLYVVAQREAELHLVSVDAVRGEWLWSTVLGDVPRSLSADPLRQRTACPVFWDAGTLIVTTANGTVIAVDATTHTPRWAYRYPLTVSDTYVRPRGENTTFVSDAWWDTWRDARMLVTDSTLVFTSPESQRLHVIDRSTGVSRWSAPRGDALWLIGVTNELAIVAGKDVATAYDLASGQPRWQTPFSPSGGRPCLTTTTLLQPLANGDLAHIAIEDGRLTLQRGVSDVPLGNLVTNGSTWCSVSEEKIARWRDPEEARAELTAMLHRDADSLAARAVDARLRLEAGDRRGARERLPVNLPPSDEWTEIARQITLADLADDPASWRTAVKQLPSEGFSSQDFELAEAITAAARRNGDSIEVARLILRWIGRTPSKETIITPGLDRRVRIDRACLGLWDDVWQSADVSQKQALSQLLEETWQEAVDGTDPFAIAKLFEVWQPLSIARRKAAEADDRQFLGRSLAAMELELLSLAEAAPAAESSPIWQRLAREMSDAGFPKMAATYRSRLRPAHPANLNGFDAGDVKLTTKTPAWPTNSPQIESQKERSDDVYQVMVPLDLDASPWFDDLDVSIDRLFRRLIFTSAEHRGTWELRLPNSNGPMRTFANSLMGWGRGRLLILRVGSELFAITPFDERGEPVARIVWMADTLVGPMVLAEQGRLEPLPMVPGVREEDLRAVNAFGRTLGQVGPVRNGYVCYLQGGTLVVLDTYTGHKLWERFNLPFDARCFGDEERLLVWSPRGHQVDVLRVSDGKLLERREWNADPDRLILLHDTLAYRMVPHIAGWKLVCEEVVSRQELWSHDAPRGASPVVLDQDTMGLVDPAGRLHFLNLQTGTALARPVSFPPMPQFERAIVTRDAETWFVALSNRVSRQAALQAPNQRNSHRTPPVDGPLMAIDRRTCQPRWRLPLARLPWPLDQSRTTPLLVYSYKLGTPDQITNGATTGTLRILDKRTGGEVVVREGQSTLGYTTIQGDPHRGLIEVRLENETLRLRYLPHPPPPSPPEP